MLLRMPPPRSAERSSPDTSGRGGLGEMSLPRAVPSAVLPIRAASNALEDVGGRRAEFSRYERRAANNPLEDVSPECRPERNSLPIRAAKNALEDVSTEERRAEFSRYERPRRAWRDVVPEGRPERSSPDKNGEE